MFYDHVRVHAKAGDGGDGSVHFHRAKFMPKGGPDGGDGGKGGDIILKVDPHTDQLRNFFFKPKLKAMPGNPGQGQNKSGKYGKDLTMLVPPGTLIYRVADPAAAKEPELENVEDGLAWMYNLDMQEDDVVPTEGDGGPERELIADLTELGEKFVLCKGGKGGRGNTNFKSSTNQAPQEAEPGVDGEEGYFYVELRKIADAGLVGFPNAGKSTLLSKLSNAKPKVASYPFTTLAPMVGVLDFEGFCRGTIADIPGLIEGASENVGLGHQFLRHIWRCRLLIFVVDIAGSEAREPIEDIQKLRTEIKLYDEDLSKRPWIIVANKMDLPDAEEKLAFLKNRFPKIDVIPISATEEEGLQELRDKLQPLIGRAPH